MRFVKTTGGWLLLVFLLTAPAWAPLTTPDWFEVHSGFLPFYHLNDLVAHGAWGWLPTLVTPPDFWRGEGPLPYVLARLWLPLGALTAIKLTLALALAAGPLSLFLAARRLWGLPPAPIAATLYAYLPFTLTTVYQRGALAETLLLALLPCLAWALLRLGARPSAGRGLFVVLLAAALPWVQAGLALLSLLALTPLPLASLPQARARRVAWLGLAGGGALGLLSRFAWQGASAGAPVVFAEHAVYLFQLFGGGAGGGLSQPGWQDDFSLTLGLVTLGLALLAWWPANRASAAIRGRMALTAVAFCGLAAAVLPLPLGALLTYPWQILGLVGLALCGLAAVGLARHPLLHGWPLLSACLALIVLSAYPSLAPPRVQAPPRAAPLAIYRDASQAPGRGVILADMTMTGNLQPAQTISVTLTWQTLQPPDFDYNLYLHVLDANEQRWGQADTQPLVERPMTQWVVGQVYTGTVSLTISPAAPPPLHLAWGLYNWQTGVRLPTTAPTP